MVQYSLSLAVSKSQRLESTQNALIYGVEIYLPKREIAWGGDCTSHGVHELLHISHIVRRLHVEE